MVLGRRQLVAARLVGDPRHREAPRVADGRAEVDRVGGVRQVLPLHDERPHLLAEVRVAHRLRVATAPRRVTRLHDGQPAAAVLDQAAPEPRQTRAEGRFPRRLVLHHGVVVHVRHGAPLVGVQTQLREVPDDDRLEVAHQVPTEGGVLHAREEEDARRLDGAARHDDELGVHGPGDAIGPDELDAGGPPALRDDPAHVGLGHELGPAGGHGPGQQRHRIALGVNRAAEERAEAAVVAGGPPVVGDAVGRRRRLVGMEPDLLRRGRRQHRAVHRRARAASGRDPSARRRTGWHRRVRPPRWPAPLRCNTARARRSRSASRRRRRPPGARGWRRAGSPPRGSAAPCRRRGSRLPRPSWGWSSPPRHACARPRRRCAGTPGARSAGPVRGSNAR